jgi:hypothetical protein
MWRNRLTMLGEGIYEKLLKFIHAQRNTAQFNVAVAAVLSGPSFSNIHGSAISSGSVTLNATGGAPNGSYTVLTSTNLASPIVTWTPITSGQFDGSGNLTGLSVTVDPTVDEQFYLLQAF